MSSLTSPSLKASEFFAQLDKKEIDCSSCKYLHDLTSFCDSCNANHSKYTPVSIPTNVLDNKDLRDKFFKECTDKNQIQPKSSRLPIISIAPHDCFEWFKKNFNPTVLTEEMIQGSEDKLHEILKSHDEKICGYQLITIKKAMREYSLLCQKELIRITNLNINPVK